MTDKSLFFNQDQGKDNFYLYCNELKKPYSISHRFIKENRIIIEHYSEGIHFLEEYLPNLEDKNMDTVYNNLQRSHSALTEVLSEKQTSLQHHFVRLDKKESKLQITEDKEAFLDKLIHDLVEFSQLQTEIYPLIEKKTNLEKMMQYCDQFLMEKERITAEKVDEIISDKISELENYFKKRKSSIILINFLVTLLLFYVKSVISIKYPSFSKYALELLMGIPVYAIIGTIVIGVVGEAFQNLGKRLWSKVKS